jgi:hypothetical protein
LCSLRAFAGIARRRTFRAIIASIAVGVARALSPWCKIEAPAATASPTAATTRRRMRLPRVMVHIHGIRPVVITATGFDSLHGTEFVIFMFILMFISVLTGDYMCVASGETV